jgi:hypothetical protein
MVLPFPTPVRHVARAERSPIGELLAHLNEADDDESLQALVSGIEDRERQAVIASLQRLCDKLATLPSAPRDYIPY